MSAPGFASIPVLCVEDDAATRAVMLRILGRRFPKVLAARDGREGLDLFLQHRPPLVITDIQMPDLDGIGMARAIREEAPATHIIVTTAHGESDLLLSAIEVGVTDYVLKPVSPRRLDEAVDKVLRVLLLEQALLASKARTERILGSISDAFFALDAGWRFTYLNPKAEDYFRTPSAALLGREFWSAFPDLSPDHQAYREAAESREPRTFDCFTPSLEAWHEVRVFPLDGGISVYMRDITEEKRTEGEIRFLAFYDQLTELPNRTLLQERLDHAILRCKRCGEEGALLFLDLDRFKNINDSLGHAAGDRVLQESARRLRACVRDSDTVARLGGDEFIILLEGFDHPDNIHSVANRILLSVAQEIPDQGVALGVTASIGICFFPGDGESADDLLKAADTAMYQGKSRGRNNYQFYRPEMNAQAHRFLLLESALRKSIQNRDFVLHFQAQHELTSGALTGFEALVRWNHPDLGMVPPDDFIPLAEETGLILPLGNWVLEAACRQAKAWMELRQAPLRMAVNLSARQFWQGNLVESVAQALALAGLPPDRLELELTESMLMHDAGLAVAKMHELTAMGVRLAMDDFGTGYSSLAALSRFPLHALKIDKSFVRDVAVNPQDAAISESILALARALGLATVAEGIETAEHLAFFRGKGCGSGQGYFFSRPLPAAEVEARILCLPPGPPKAPESPQFQAGGG